jgi:hypothetical protein
MDHPVTPFAAGILTHGRLNDEFAAVGSDLDDLRAEVQTGLGVIGGAGKEAGGCGLTTGTGLSCVLAAGYYWVGGVRCHLAASKVIALTASQTSYLYQDAAGSVTAYTTRQTPNPAGTWFLGTATTGSSTCSAVDDSGADVVSATAGLAEAVAQTETALGTPYFGGTPPADVDSRLTALEAGGGGGGGPAYYGPLTESSGGGPQTLSQRLTTDEGRLTVLEAAGVGSGGVATVQAPPWNVDAANQALQLQAQTDATHLEAAESQIDTVQVKWGVYGDGTASSPNFIDPDSTWLPA